MGFKTWHWLVFGMFGLLTRPALAQADSAVIAEWDKLLTQRMEQFLRKPLEHCAVDVRRTTIAHRVETLHVNTMEVAIILLGDDFEPSQSEKLYDFLDSASAFFHRQGTPMKLLSGQSWVPTVDIAVLERKQGFIYVPSLLGCVRSAEQSHGLDVFDLRTELLLDASDRPSNEERMVKLRQDHAKRMAKVYKKRRGS